MAKTMEKAEGKSHAAEAKVSVKESASAKDSTPGKDSSVKDPRDASASRPQFQAQIAPSPARDSALTRAVQQIEKQFGKGAVMKLNGNAISPIEGIATGSLSLDIALGGAGIPRGRVIEIFGPESSGKTTLTLAIIASAQSNGGTAAFVDAEHALDPVYAEKLGVKVNDLLVSQPDTGEQALEITDMLVRSGAVDVVVVDSVAALTPKAEIEGEMGD